MPEFCHHQKVGSRVVNSERRGKGTPVDNASPDPNHVIASATKPGINVSDRSVGANVVTEVSYNLSVGKE